MSNPTRLVSILALTLLTACGSGIDKGPKKGSENNTANNANNVTSNNANNVTPNNSNNVTPNNSNNVTPNNGDPCVGVSPASLNFGDVALGAQAEATVTIENCSDTESLTLDDAATIAGFEVALPEVAQIPPQTTFPLTILFSPVSPGGHVGMITIATSAGAVSVNVQGNGLESIEGCPTPVAQGRPDGSADPWSPTVTTFPLSTVALTAMNSTAPSTIESYEWTIVNRPAGSTARLTPSATVADPSLMLDLAGTYEIDLRVATARSPDDCPAARMTINAQVLDPNEIHVQLTWDTPADPNQTDFDGADLDLHYKHPSGIWNMEPYDCYWLNKDADWGADGMASVDIDDVDGAGPENISHRNAGALTYQIGVHYFADKGFGASTATLRLSRGGTLVAEMSELLAATGQFWHVGAFNAATDTFTQNGAITDGFPP